MCYVGRTVGCVVELHKTVSARFHVAFLPPIVSLCFTLCTCEHASGTKVLPGPAHPYCSDYAGTFDRQSNHLELLKCG